MTRRRQARTALRAVLLGWAGLSWLGCVACAPAGPDPSPSWREVVLPGAPAITALTTSASGEVLVGTRAADGSPGVARVLTGQQISWLTLRPQTGYARSARWVQLAAGPEGVLAVGGAAGGAHSNTRWTVWRTGTHSPDVLAEEEQTFETFGGWDAGDVTGAAWLGADPVLVGSWKGEHGLDVATWRPQGSRWLRDAPGPALMSTADALVSAAGVASTDTAVVIAGDVLDLAGGRVSRPAVWTAARTAGPWTRHLLSGEGRGQSIGCAATVCTVLGVDDTGHVSAWTVWPDGRSTRIDLPPVQALATTALPAPAVRDATAWMAIPTSTGTRLLRTGDGPDVTLDAPPGTPVGVVAAGERLYLATEVDGVGRLWLTEAG